MNNRTITALYDSYDQAAQAVGRLEAAGVPHSDIAIVANNQDDQHAHRVSGSHSRSETADDASDGAGTGATLGTVLGGGAGLLAGLGLMAIPGLGPVVAAGWLVSTITGAGIGAAAGGLVGSLTGAGMSEADAHAYSEGVRRGGTLVTVRAGDQNFQQVVDILEEHGSVDMDERERSWRSDGWQGHMTDHDATMSSTRGASEIGTSGAIGAAAGTTAGLGATAFGTDRDLTSGMGSTGMDATTEHRSGASGDKGFGEKVADTLGLSGSSDGRSTDRAAGMGAGYTGTDRAASSDRHEAIPIVEENLEVGKRDVNRGRVRVHSHTVETPVQEQVTLRDEHVHVERRPVDRPATAGEDLFRERTIEAVEHDEEAVVSKQARVKEELVIDKEVEQRTQTVSDTVRHTEVEVEDERGNRVSGTGTTGGTFDRNR